MHPEVTSERPGLCPDCGMNLVPTKRPATSDKRRGYSCPMHPEVQSDRSGMCPECGMGLVPSKKQRAVPTGRQAKSKEHDHGPGKEYDKHAGHKINIFARKFWVSLILTVPVVLYSELPEKLLGWHAPEFPGSAYLSFILGSIVFFYGGFVFLMGAWREIRGRLPGMMTLIALAVSAAYLWSVYAVLAGGEHGLFWELTTLITIMLLGHWMEMKAVQGAQGALRELSKLLPDTAELVTNDQQQTTRTVPLSELKEGDVVLVRPGGKIPADGMIVDGASDVNESMVTGESKPVAKRAGQEVIAGTINGDGSLKIKVTKIGEHTFLAGVMRLVAEAQASKSRLQILSDRAALYLTGIAVTTGIITFVAWILAEAGIAFAVERLVAVLVIACPHALGLAVPLVASISTTMAARNGLLVKQRLALEAARSVTTVLFDKTGTLTKGEYGVTHIWPVNSMSEQEILRLAASVDAHSEHFIAHAIVDEARKRNIALSDARDFSRIPGKGVAGVVDGVRITITGITHLEDGRERISASIEQELQAAGKAGTTLIAVLRESELLGIIGLADVIREESREAIRALKALGVKIAMVTGDSREVAEWVAKELNLDEYFANVLPHEKSEKVKLLQAKGEKVAMVGDGVNDAPALTQADLGIAIGAGTNVAIESAGIILVRSDPRDIVKIIRLSRLTYTKMIQNLFWATGYNIIALPLGAGVLAFKGIILEPALAALFMSLSTVIVAVNALVLRRKTL